VPFVNSYKFPADGRFRKLVQPAMGLVLASEIGRVLAVGSVGGRGAVSLIAGDGSVSWSKSYALPEFVDGVAAGESDFVLLASTGTAPFDNVLVRIDASGNLLWARRLSEKGRPIRLCQAAQTRGSTVGEEYLVVLDVERNAASYGLAVANLVRVAADGSRVASALLSMTGVCRIFDAMATDDGYALVGDFNTGLTLAQWLAGDLALEFEALAEAGLLVTVDAALGICKSKLLRAPAAARLSIRTIAVAMGRFVVAGGIQGDAGAVQAFAANTDLNDASGFAYAAIEHPATRPVAIGFLPGVVKNNNADLLETIDLPVRQDPSTMPVGELAGDPVILIGHRPDAQALTSQILHLDPTLAPQNRYLFGFDDDAALFDLSARGGSVAVAGGAPGTPATALILSVDSSFDCCRTHALGIPPNLASRLALADGKCTLKKTKGEAAALGGEAQTTAVAVSSLCGTAIGLTEPYLMQSPYLSLQAAGSQGVDASRGMLLRWFLSGTLADHLPKGDLALGSAGFNKPGDFVTLYRADWLGVPGRQLNFAVDLPRLVDDANRILYFAGGAASDLFAVQFPNTTAYAAAKQIADPATNFSGFLTAYGAHPFEIELRNVLAVACDVTFQPSAGGTLKVETRSVGENRPLSDKQVTSRRVLGASDAPGARLFAENMRSVRIQATAATVQAVSFICYEDVFADLNARAAWFELGRFALSTDQATVFKRLEEPGRFTVNGLWRKYDAAAPVNVANYQARWSDPSEGLGAAVQSYLQLSETDPAAATQLNGAAPEDGTISVSYRDLLLIASTDYHVARMFGLGHVDTAIQLSSYIYLIRYDTLGDLGDGQGARAVEHLYMSLPTLLGQDRLPLVPDLDGVEYGLSVPAGSGVPYPLTDPQGYTPDGTARFIRLYPGCRPLYAPEQGFFDPPDLFDLSAASLPAFYAVEYRRQGETAWRRPAIAHDGDFLDAGSPPQPEILVTPFPTTQRASAFIHKETEAGIHEYAVRGVNLFSRASPLGPVHPTDTTVFTPRNTLLPPSDLQTQFIQIESTPVLTTPTEQAMLAALAQSATDTTLVRVCCNYGMAQDSAYGFADTIEALHRRLIPGNVTGAVVAVADAADPALLRIETGPYAFSGGQPSAQPSLPPPMKANFVGGVLVTGGTRLTVEDIQWPNAASADNPIFFVRKPTTTGVVNNAGANTMMVQNAPLDIHPGDLLMAVENLAAAASWGAGNPLTTTVQIGDASWANRTESFTRADGTTVTRRLRGVWDTAQIAPDGSDPKRYVITFDTYALDVHPQALAPDPVSWWKGTVRVPVAGRDPEDRRNLTVLQILALKPSMLVLLAADDSGEADAVATGSGRLVNYYPGYRFYLHADGPKAFDGANLLPAAGEGARTTLLGLCSRDSATLDGAAQPYRSAVGMPQLLAAIEIREPKVPQKPRGLKYASPPDAYGKSSYTLSVDFDDAPFAVAFYRADAFNILSALYDDASLAQIRAAIFPPENDPYFTNRFEDLFAFLDDGRTTPDAIPNTGDFAFPVPDAAALQLPSGPLAPADKAKIKAALLDAFVPLTEQPLIYDLVRTDPAYIPTGKPQKFRNANGDVLAPGDPEFDLAPMAKRPGGNSIQFVDFTLDGSMNPNTVYFYFAREIGNRMQMGEPSAIFGPVKLVNLRAPAAPKLRKLIVVPYDPGTRAAPQIEFEVIAPSALDPMATLRIYRAVAGVDALSLRTMQAVADIDLATVAPTPDGTLVVADDFSSDPFVPYGDPLFYRLTWVRSVKSEDANQVVRQFEVVSEPTRTFLANVIDVTHPAPPVPAFQVLSTATDGGKFLRATWTKAVHNGTYYLSRLAPTGNWLRIGSLRTNDPAPAFDLPDALPVNDQDGNPIYYRFKIDVESSGGLLNTYDTPVTARLDLLP
jgi:hypothetical protein